MNFFTKLLDHVAWADVQVSAAIAALDIDRVERSQATRIYSHVAAAEHIWYSRLEHRSPAHVVWPDLSLEAAAALARESLAGLRAIAMGDAETLAREVEYRTSAGQAFRNSVADILSHSTYWPSTVIFVIEDDPQDGGDHVDNHRSPLQVIIPWARRGVV